MLPPGILVGAAIAATMNITIASCRRTKRCLRPKRCRPIWGCRESPSLQPLPPHEQQRYGLLEVDPAPWNGAVTPPSVLPPNMDGAVVTHTISAPRDYGCRRAPKGSDKHLCCARSSSAALLPSAKPPRITIIATIAATINDRISHCKSTQPLGHCHPHRIRSPQSRLCIPTEFRRIPAEFRHKAPAVPVPDRNRRRNVL
jgi:hypothetical protein